MKRILTMLALLASALFAPAALAETTSFRSTMSGPSEEPPNASPGYGVAEIIIDDVAHTMQMMIPFNDLLGATTVAHIHCCTASPLTGTAGPATSVPTLPGFPLGVSSGVYNVTMDLTDPTTYSTAFLTANNGDPAAAEAAFIAGITANMSYLNIHTDLYPNGEIRGFLVAAPVTVIPEPSQWMMMSLGVLALGVAVRRRRKE